MLNVLCWYVLCWYIFVPYIRIVPSFFVSLLFSANTIVKCSTVSVAGMVLAGLLWLLGVLVFLVSVAQAIRVAIRGLFTTGGPTVGPTVVSTGAAPTVGVSRV